jgi:hypothetical protein
MTEQSTQKCVIIRAPAGGPYERTSAFSRAHLVAADYVKRGWWPAEIVHDGVVCQNPQHPARYYRSIWPDEQSALLCAGCTSCNFGAKWPCPRNSQ